MEEEDQCSKRLKLNKAKIIKISALALYHAYLGYAIYHKVQKRPQDSWEFCHGIGFLLTFTVLVYICYFLPWIFGLISRSELVSKVRQKLDLVYRHRMVKIVVKGLFMGAMTTFVVIDTNGDLSRMVSYIGLFVLILVAFVGSKTWSKVDWNQVINNLVIQFIFGLAILRWEPGQRVLECIGDKVESFLAFTNHGSALCYGYLVNRKPFLPDLLPNNSLAYNVTKDINQYQAVPGVVVFKSLSTIFFFSFIANMLFYLGLVQSITIRLGLALRWLIGTTSVESVNATANIFLGPTMTPFLIKPYLEDLTMSELHAVISAGFATVAGTIMAAYISFGISPHHLLAASVMSAPAALACAKILYPETEESSPTDAQFEKDVAEGKAIASSTDANIIDAATKGAASAGLLVVNVVAIVVAFVSFVAFLNSLFTFGGGLVGIEEDLTFESVLGKIFMPLAYIMGIPWEECELVGQLVGLKTAVNEFVAYKKLGMVSSQLSKRSVSITTYALCGFANPGCIGIQVATLGTLCPQRRSDVSRVILRSFVAGSIACFMTACIAGTLISS